MVIKSALDSFRGSVTALLNLPSVLFFARVREVGITFFVESGCVDFLGSCVLLHYLSRRKFVLLDLWPGVVSAMTLVEACE
jgi:hypothetical protein